MKRVKDAFDERAAALDGLLGVGRSFDMIGRTLRIGGRRARLWVVNGYADDTVLERAISAWLPIPSLEGVGTLQAFADRYVSVCDAAVETDRLKAVTSVFAGKTLLVIDGFSGGVVLDAKQFPLRSVEEPDTSKVLRGSHDGFGESVMKNAALLRRRIRDPHLTMEGLKVGQRTHSDVALCYLDDRVDHALLDELRHKLQNIQANSLTMAQESVAEAIRPKQWYNPFPKVRYTERPDTAAACVMEGSIILMVDNSAAVMILPTTFFDFTQEANDFYFPPLVGTYLRVLRVTVFLISLLITPAWYLMVSSPGRLPSWLDFLSSPEPAALSLLSQLLVVEFLMAQKIEVAGYTGHASEKAGEEDPKASLTEQEKAYVAEYLQDINNMDVTNEQEAMLDYYLPKVVEEAIKVHTTGAFIGDLIQEGSLSLMMAMSEAEGEPVEEEILEKVRMDMQMTLESQSETKRQEDKMVQKVSDLDETIRNMKEEYGRKVSVDEVADRMQISEDDVADIMKLAGEEIKDEE